MRLLAVTVLSCLLGLVYWLGATVYSERIEEDIATRTQPAIDEHRPGVADIAREVDGRDVRITGLATSESIRKAARESADDVWGVRVVENNIGIAEPAPPPPPPVQEPEEVGFDLFAHHRYPLSLIHI